MVPSLNLLAAGDVTALLANVRYVSKKTEAARAEIPCFELVLVHFTALLRSRAVDRNAQPYYSQNHGEDCCSSAGHVHIETQAYHGTYLGFRVEDF